MTSTEEAVLLYRLEELEKRVRTDHEPRIRELEKITAKVAVWSAGGALLGGGIIAALAQYFLIGS